MDIDDTWTPTRTLQMLTKYGISKEDYYAMLKSQGGGCKICGERPGVTRHKKNKGDEYYLHVDHNHSNGAVRGLLCVGCNIGLGAFRDNIKSMEAAITYLKETI